MSRLAPSEPLRANRIRFDRNELAGSFGDVGTDLPLILAMIPAAGLDTASVFILFGILQITTGLLYALPMPVQPLKAMAVLVIAGGIPADTLAGAGIAIAVVMLLLTLTGALAWLARAIPLCVVRGIQVGLGLALANLALRTYVPADGPVGYALAGGAFVLTIALLGNRRWPAALFVVALGIAYALIARLDPATIASGFALALPSPTIPNLDAILTGAIVLALPQLPLSLSNSVIATAQTTRDLFPHRPLCVRRIGLTYSLMNLTAPLLGGIPVCHGCGGLAGHYAFGARTGGSVVIYGTFFLFIGLLFSDAAAHVIEAFPRPILGVVLLFESLFLIRLVADVAKSRRDLTIAILTALIAALLPQGFVLALCIGTALVVISDRTGILRDG